MSAQAAPAVWTAEELERFETRSRLEILGTLRELVARRAPVSVHFDRGEEFLLSTLLAVNPEFEELVFDASAERAANARVERSERLLFVSSLDHVRIQFVAQRAEPVVHEGLPAFRVRIPQALVRLQRREYFRIAAPVAKPLFARLAHPREPARVLELRVLDLSAGGLAVALPPGALALEPGTRLERGTLDLPGVGEIAFCAEVRYLAAAPSAAGVRRCGLMFCELSGADRSRLQRYILRLERERASRL
jgi:c-di-GMP-binding flagellar brake protein YcgR